MFNGISRFLVIAGCAVSSVSYMYTTALALYTGNLEKAALHMSMATLFAVCGVLWITKE